VNNFHRVETHMTTDCHATFKIVVVEFCLQFSMCTRLHLWKTTQENDLITRIWLGFFGDGKGKYLL
jgi:hypothetical protein